MPRRHCLRDDKNRGTTRFIFSPGICPERNIALVRLTRGGRVNLLFFQPTGSKVIFRCFRLRSRTDRPLSGRLSHPTLFFSAFFALPYYITEKKGACQFESAGFSKKPGRSFLPGFSGESAVYSINIRSDCRTGAGRPPAAPGCSSRPVPE